MGTEYILELKHISKSFPGVKALDDVTLCVRPGTVHSLMGENGAGKSTLMKCLFGIYSFDEGEIILDGKNIKFSSPSEALQNHVSMVHQELNQVLNQTVMENMSLGSFPMKHGLVDDQKMYEDKRYKKQYMQTDGYRPYYYTSGRAHSISTEHLVEN